MKAKTKSFILQCIERSRGDDLYRATNAFKNCTADEMNEEYGESGLTRQQILDSHIAHNAECDEAITAIRNLN